MKPDGRGPRPVVESYLGKCQGQRTLLHKHKYCHVFSGEVKNFLIRKEGKMTGHRLCLLSLSFKMSLMTMFDFGTTLGP